MLYIIILNTILLHHIFLQSQQIAEITRKYKQNLIMYRKAPCLVPPLSSLPLKLSKSWSLAKILV